MLTTNEVLKQLYSITQYPNYNIFSDQIRINTAVRSFIRYYPEGAAENSVKQINIMLCNLSQTEHTKDQIQEMLVLIGRYYQQHDQAKRVDYGGRNNAKLRY